MIEEQLMTLVLLFVFAIIGGIIAQRFKQPIVLGFLLIGTLIGPFALNLVDNHEFIDLVIEFGAILLMFVVGLEFTPEQIKKVGVKGFILGLVKVAISFFLGFVAAVAFGLGVADGIFIGLMFSFTSTVIFVKILDQKNLIKRTEVPLMLSVLVVDDIIAVIFLTMLTSASSSAGLPVVTVIENLLIGIAILVMIYFFFQKFANKVVNILLKYKNEELVTFLSLALCAGLSYFAYFLGLSPTAGAFLAGSIIASMKDSKELGHAVLPHNLMFSSLFFLAVGTLINFKALLENIWLVLFLLGAFVVVIFIAIGLTVYLFGNMRKEQPIFCALIMLPLGEFSLLLAKEAKAFNTSVDFVSLTAVLIFLTTVLMSLTVNKSNQIYALLENKRPGNFKRRLHALGNYISGFVEQLDTENTFTNRFKKSASKTVILTLVFVFISIGAHKLLQLMTKLDIQMIYIYLAGVFFIIVAALLGFLVYKNGKETYALSVNITSYIDKSMNTKRANKTLRNLITGMLIIYIGLISPGFIFILQLPSNYVLGSVGIILIGLFIISRVFSLLSHFSNEYAGHMPTYKKFNPDLARFQRK